MPWLIVSSGECDPIAEGVSFERFLSLSRAKPPDVDLDFPDDRREEMAQYVRDTYGEQYVANVANYITYKGRSMLRDVGRVLGLDGSEIDQLRELLPHCRGDDLAAQLSRVPELRALALQPERYADLFAICACLAHLPRHLGTHGSGLVIGDRPLSELVPLVWAGKGVRMVALDRDDVEAPGVGLLKFDGLCLRWLRAIDLAVDAISQEDPEFDYAHRDREDAATLAMIRAAQTIPVFQLQSPAQILLQARLQANKYRDLVASIALIRPRPLLGGSVEPYLRRRHGWERVTYPLPQLEPVLRESYGRIIYQDQVLEVVTIVGSFTPDEADEWLKGIPMPGTRRIFGG